MEISIQYCVMWNYKPKAQSVRDEILETYPDAKVNLYGGDKGQFDVTYYKPTNLPAEAAMAGVGILIFNKHNKNRFPNTGEIVEEISKNM